MSTNKPISLLNDGLPLTLRLRIEAAEWDEGEGIAALLIEAAEAVELLACEVAIQKPSRAAARSGR